MFGYVIEAWISWTDLGDVIRRIDISEGTASQLPTYADPTLMPRPQQKAARWRGSAGGRDVYNTTPDLDLDTAKIHQATIETDKTAS